MKNQLRGIALLLFALLLATVGLVMEEIVLIVGLGVGLIGLVLAFWDGVSSLWHKLTEEDKNENTDNS